MGPALASRLTRLFAARADIRLYNDTYMYVCLCPRFCFVCVLMRTFCACV